ncbi:MAG: type II toxin-antitoxin system HigA family antitoxin [Leptolyngbyaceae cyanobacterium]
MTLGLEPPSSYYIQLLTHFPPRPITTDGELEETQQQIDQLLDKDALTKDDHDFLNILGMLVYDYEQQHEPEFSLRGLELLKALMQEESLQPDDLVPPFENRAVARAVLNGGTPMNVFQIQALAERFHLAPENFL